MRAARAHADAESLRAELVRVEALLEVQLAHRRATDEREAALVIKEAELARATLAFGALEDVRTRVLLREVCEVEEMAVSRSESAARARAATCAAQAIAAEMHELEEALEHEHSRARAWACALADAEAASDAMARQAEAAMHAMADCRGELEEERRERERERLEAAAAASAARARDASSARELDSARAALKELQGLEGVRLASRREAAEGSRRLEEAHLREAACWRASLSTPTGLLARAGAIAGEVPSCVACGAEPLWSSSPPRLAALFT